MEKDLDRESILRQLRSITTHAAHAVDASEKSRRNHAAAIVYAALVQQEAENLYMELSPEQENVKEEPQPETK